MKTFQITLTIEVEAQDEKSANKLAAKYKDSMGRLVLARRSTGILPTRVLEVKEKTK